MNKLTPEERQRIYLEEKARLEMRQQLVAEQITEHAEPAKRSTGEIIGWAVLFIVAAVIILAAIGSYIEEHDAAAFRELSPEQQHARTVAACAGLLKEQQYKLYSELTVEERKIRASCAAEAEGVR